MNEEIKKIFDVFVDEFTKDGQGKKIFEEGKDVIVPYLESWARAKYMLISGNSGQKEVAKEVIKAVERSISDIKDALNAKLVNYAVDKLENILRSIITKFLLPALIAL